MQPYSEWTAWLFLKASTQRMLCWVKMYVLVMVQNPEPRGLSRQGWHDSAKCQRASGAFPEQLGRILGSSAFQ